MAGLEVGYHNVTAKTIFKKVIDSNFLHKVQMIDSKTFTDPKPEADFHNFFFLL